MTHFSQYQNEQLHHLVQKIAATTGVDKIYCYGTRITQMQRWSPFQTSKSVVKTATVSVYDLALVMYDGDTRSEHTIGKLMDSLANSLHSFSYIITRTINVEMELVAQRRFMSTLYSKAALLYDGSGLRLKYNSTRLSLHSHDYKIPHTWANCLQIAETALQQVRSTDSTDLLQIAVRLRLAVSGICAGLIYTYTGFNARGIPLSQALQLCDNFCAIRIRCFPCNTPEENSLFSTLENARQALLQNRAMHISKETVDTLVERVNCMYQLAQEYYREKMGISNPETRLVSNC